MNDVNRYEQIIAAYHAAIGDRDPAKVDILDLLPAIDAAVPNASPAEIAAALRWAADQAFREAEALEEWGRKRGWSRPPANDV